MVCCHNNRHILTVAKLFYEPNNTIYEGVSEGVQETQFSSTCFTILEVSPSYKKALYFPVNYFYLFFLSVNVISGTTPRGDTGGGPSLACKHQDLWIPASLHVNVWQELHQGGNRDIWSSSCFVQILWLCSCLTIKDL